jgi:MFS family permease
LALGSTLVVGGTSGIAAGAYLSDLLAKIRAWGRPVIIPIGFVLGAPAIYLALHSAGELQFLLYFGLGAFFLSWYHGPLTATIHDLVPPHGRATALGLYYLFVNLFAMAVAPLIVGWIANHSNLITAFKVRIVSQLIGAAFFVLVIQSIRRNGLHHPALARHWREESCRGFPRATAAVVEASNV